MQPKTLTRVTLAAAVLAFAAPALSAPTGNIAAGKTKSATCAACHGADGNKALDGPYPLLAGQYPDYLSKALHEYKNGKRKNAIMAGQAAALTEQDIADLAAYFGSQRGTVHDLSGHQR
jgi:cytochrome c553